MAWCSASARVAAFSNSSTIAASCLLTFSSRSIEMRTSAMRRAPPPPHRCTGWTRHWANQCRPPAPAAAVMVEGDTAVHETSWQMRRSEEHTSELQSRGHLVCRLLLEKKKKAKETKYISTQKIIQHNDG